MYFHLTPDQLLSDLYTAYYDARRHKRNKPYQQRFEAHLDENIHSLCEALINHTYKPYPSTCFVITDPKPREVFAAHFRDRIVHHLYFNYTHTLFERTFIQDSYSCIKGRGTHYGINRLYHHILAESQNYTRPCYVLKMDIRGYFMNIDRQRLCDIATSTLYNMSSHRVGKYRPTTWDETLDMDFLHYLTREIILLNPIEDCISIGPPSDRNLLPRDKSLYNSPQGCGLPIGNLTSQLFSNVYLNVFDQYMKRELHCKHYGRYVDDFYVVSTDKTWLESLIPQITEFLETKLGLSIHEGKTIITPIEKGVEYLGAFVLPYRIYISRATLRRMSVKLNRLAYMPVSSYTFNALASYAGVLSHWQNNRVRWCFVEAISF